MWGNINKMVVKNIDNLWNDIRIGLDRKIGVNLSYKITFEIQYPVSDVLKEVDPKIKEEIKKIKKYKKSA